MRLRIHLLLGLAGIFFVGLTYFHDSRRLIALRQASLGAAEETISRPEERTMSLTKPLRIHSASTFNQEYITSHDSIGSPVFAGKHHSQTQNGVEVQEAASTREDGRLAWKTHPTPFEITSMGTNLSGSSSDNGVADQEEAQVLVAEAPRAWAVEKMLHSTGPSPRNTTASADKETDHPISSSLHERMGNTSMRERIDASHPMDSEEDWPALSSLIDNVTSVKKANVTGDISFLLDFAIVGRKCVCLSQ